MNVGTHACVCVEFRGQLSSCQHSFLTFPFAWDQVTWGIFELQSFDLAQTERGVLGWGQAKNMYLCLEKCQRAFMGTSWPEQLKAGQSLELKRFQHCSFFCRSWAGDGWRQAVKRPWQLYLGSKQLLVSRRAGVDLREAEVGWNKMTRTHSRKWLWQKPDRERNSKIEFEEIRIKKMSKWQACKQVMIDFRWQIQEIYYKIFYCKSSHKFLNTSHLLEEGTWAWEYSLVVKCMLSMYDDLGSIPSIKKKKTKK